MIGEQYLFWVDQSFQQVLIKIVKREKRLKHRCSTIFFWPMKNSPSCSGLSVQTLGSNIDWGGDSKLKVGGLKMRGEASSPMALVSHSFCHDPATIELWTFKNSLPEFLGDILESKAASFGPLEKPCAPQLSVRKKSFLNAR